MSDELEALILRSLSESEKSAPEIWHWIHYRLGDESPNGGTLRDALDGLESAGLIERYNMRMVPEFPKIEWPLWIYRLTEDGALKQWAGEVSIPKEYSPA